MTMDRRSFFAGGAGLGAGLGIGAVAMLTGPQAEAAPIAPAMPILPTHMGRSVLDFGVEANTEADQSPALQRALDEIAASFHPAFLPPGVYQIGCVNLPQHCSLQGVAGNSAVMLSGGLSFRAERGDASLSVTGISFSHGDEARGVATKAGLSITPVLFASGGKIVIENCHFGHVAGSAFDSENADIRIVSSSFDRINLAGVVARNPASALISNCKMQHCGQAIWLVAVNPKSEGAIISSTRIKDCADVGVSLEGRAIVTSNIIEGCKTYGLKLGDTKGTSHILASQNSITNCRVGIACEVEGDYIFATLNMIQGAKDGAIRAIADGKLVGPDLAQQSAESYRNLAIAGNVAL